MKPIKIYGESKTGTTYLEKLLKKNVDTVVFRGSHYDELGWKHGFPKYDSEITYVFIFRDVYETAKSLMADVVDKRFNGLEGKFGNIDGKKYENHWQNWDNWLDCRKAKYYAYLGFWQINGGFLLNYDYLRKNPWCISVLGAKGHVKDIKNHSYKPIKGKDNPNRKPLTEDQKEYISENIDRKLELFVNNLTING